MLVETDRDKHCANWIVDFYWWQATDFTDHFRTAWRLKHRSALGEPKASLPDFARLCAAFPSRNTVAPSSGR